MLHSATPVMSCEASLLRFTFGLHAVVIHLLFGAGKSLTSSLMGLFLRFIQVYTSHSGCDIFILQEKLLPCSESTVSPQLPKNEWNYSATFTCT